MRHLVSALLVLTLPACISVRELDSVQVDGSGLRVVSGRIDRGDLAVLASRGSETIEVEAVVWGRGSRRERAEQRQDAVRWSAVREGDALLLDGASTENRSGVDLSVFGPPVVDVDVVADNGDVALSGIEGVHLITANNITGDVIGDLDIFASQSVDLNFTPYGETDARIVSDGGVTLGLPFGLSYDLTIRGNIDESMEIEDLGWDDLVLGDGFVNGIRGRGDIEIDITVAGPVRIVSVR